MPSMKDSKVPAPKKMNNPMLKMHNPIHNGDSDSSEEDAGVAVKLTSVKIASKDFDKIARPAGDSAGSDKDVPSGKQTLVIGKSARLGGKVVTKTVDMAKLTDGEKLEMAQQRKMARYEEIFNRFDSDGSGSIDTPELAHVLNALGHEVPEAELDTLMAEMDEDNSGDIDFEELCNAIENGTLSKRFDSDFNKQIEEMIFGHDVEARKRSLLDEGFADPDTFFGLLHPETTRRKTYDMVQMMLLFWTLYILPIRIAFAITLQPDEAAYWIDVAVDLFFMGDLLVQMHTYYKSTRSNQWVSNQKKIRRKYFRGWFVVDFIAVFPADYLVRFLSWHSGTEARSFRMLRLARLLRYARVLKLINPQKLNFIYDQIQGFLGWNAMTMDFILRIVILTVSFFVFNHTLGLLLVFKGREDSALIEPYGPGGNYWDHEYKHMVLGGVPVTVGQQYVDAVYFIHTTVTTVGYGDLVMRTTDERLTCYMIMVAASFFYAFVIGTFAILIANRRRDRSLFEAKMRGVFTFLDMVQCPKEVQDRAGEYYRYRYPNRTLFDENEIFQELPLKLRNEVVLHRFERTICNVPFFRGCPSEITTEICLRLRGHRISPGVAIVEQGEESADLVLMDRGSATGTDGAITVGFEAGSFFGELQFLGLAARATMRVVANEFCEYYTLRYDHIMDIMAREVELKAKLAEYSKLRAQAMGKELDRFSLDDLESEINRPAEKHCKTIEFRLRVANSKRANLEKIVAKEVEKGTIIYDHGKFRVLGSTNPVRKT